MLEDVYFGILFIWLQNEKIIKQLIKVTYTQFSSIRNSNKKLEPQISRNSKKKIRNWPTSDWKKTKKLSSRRLKSKKIRNSLIACMGN